MRIAMNGFGRIGRCVARMFAEDETVELVAINDPGDHDQLVHLLRYDSAHGRCLEAERTSEGFRLGRQSPRLLAEYEPSKLPWKELNIDVVLECSGRFTTREMAAKHLDAGAERVVISAPGKNADATIVFGINQHLVTSDRRVLSNASCTTNCLAPVVKVLDDSFGIVAGTLTTVHAVTNDQRLLDLPHPKDYRRARAAIANIVPTSTGAASALKLVFPEAEWAIHGMAVRVPVIDVSMIDLVITTKAPVTVERVNDAFRQAAQSDLAGVLRVEDDPIVSSDLIGTSHSSIIDAGLTATNGDHLLRVVSWYDNEWGFSARMVDLVHHIGRLGRSQ
tara:strand:+ start:1842 stop:2846 length:1005 start_codon:yes stop_codon:yes gene_type:complete